MLLRLAFCLPFITIVTNTAIEPLTEEIQHTKTNHRLETIDNILATFVQQSKALQRLATTRSLEVQHLVASLPRECTVDGLKTIEVEGKNLLANYYKCNVFQLVEDIGTVSVDFAKYFYDSYKDSAVIVGNIVACTSSGFNPISFVICIYKAASIIPMEIKDIISLTEDFEDTLDTLMPRIYQGIKSCFNKTSSAYNIYLNDVVEKSNLCASSRIV